MCQYTACLLFFVLNQICRVPVHTTCTISEIYKTTLRMWELKDFDLKVLKYCHWKCEIDGDKFVLISANESHQMDLQIELLMYQTTLQRARHINVIWY